MSKVSVLLCALVCFVCAGAFASDVTKSKSVTVVKESGTATKSVTLVERDGYCSHGKCRSVERTKTTASAGCHGGVTVAKSVTRKRVK